MSGALAGVRVLDLTQMMAGPFCTMLLADQGADVIKIEPPEGEGTRVYGPHFDDDAERHYGGYFQSINRNKRSVCIDLKSVEGKEAFRRLVAGADVVIENFRAGVMDRLDLGYEALAAINPALVYGAIRGFGDPRTGVSP
ncbi:MAG: CoA transferase, partial [Alphaproteobacteria bacterium]|nr:CoA transferase [Alphaproteobacteria bacterium]